MIKYKAIYVGIIALLFSTSCESKAEADAKKLAELFCRQSKIVETSGNMQDENTIKELQSIDDEATKINEEITNTYSKDIEAMDDFAKTYQEAIKNCK